MKSKFILLTSVALAAVAFTYSSASAADPIAPERSPIYVSVFGGASFLNDVNGFSSGTSLSVRTNLGYIFGGAIGAHLNDNFRAELELSHASWSVNSISSSGSPFSPAQGQLSATYILGNVWYDFKSESAFTPYIGGGLGVGLPNQDFTANGGVNSDTPVQLAFQLGVGAKYALSDKIDLDIGYRFKDIPNFTQKFTGFPDVTGNTFASHNVQIGLTFNF